MSSGLSYRKKEVCARIKPEVRERLEAIGHLRPGVAKRSRNRVLVMMIVGILVLGLTIYTGNFLYLIIIGGIWYFIDSKFHDTDAQNMESLLTAFHNETIPKILDGFLTTGYYRRADSISQADYYKSKIFTTKIDSYKGSDYISGTLGDTGFLFSKLHTQYESQNYDSNSTDYVTVFKGIFMVIEFNKNVKGGRAFLFPDLKGKYILGLDKWFPGTFNNEEWGERILMEDDEFEKLYSVYSFDPVDAHYVLTPKMQHNFVELSKHFDGKEIHASFINDKMYLAIEGDYELFAFDSTSSYTDSDTLEYYIGDFVKIIETVDILDLNVRIWGE